MTSDNKDVSTEPDFSDFADWHVARQEERWPHHHKDKKLSSKQIKIVERNKNLLLTPACWAEKTRDFEKVLSIILDEAVRRKKRAEFCIHLDFLEFPSKSYDFGNYFFPCSVSFCGAKFGIGDISFKGASFGDGYVNFVGAKFGSGNFSFRDATFARGNISFSDVVFEEGVISFARTDFGDGHVIFVRAVLGDGNVSFREAKFGSGNVSFKGAAFGVGDVRFTKAVFGDGDVSFKDVTFMDGSVSFYESFFGGGSISFRGTTFGDGDISFKRTSFGDGGISFSKASFGAGNVTFGDATFGDGDVSFGGAIFGDGNVQFTKTLFGDGNTMFNRMTLGQTSISFVDAMVKGNFFIRYNNYPLNVDFQRLFVGGTADFSNCTFHEVPDFTDSKFDRPPDASGMEVLTFQKMKIWKLWIWPWWKASKDEGAKFRKLKAMALAANDHEKDGEFFAYEMLAKRGYEAGNTGPIALFINWLYFTFSNFGQSYVRPMIAMFLSYFSFAIYYATQVNPLLKSAEMNDFALGYSFRNVFPFLGSLLGAVFHPKDHKSRFEEIYEELLPQSELIDWLVNVGFVQNAIGAVLLFLLLLGLRNKFRLK